MNSNVEVRVNAQGALNLKDQLIADGLRIDHDFVWYFNPLKYDGFASYPDYSYVSFEFNDPALASFYRLKWS
jgi:hypothetical protein